mmetsp:Transcript_23874/g.30394  ORF Transcript_23874/g.30394 Transcript_23874/m.30394 type:complete len:93 (-) Transcript_23874:32-310(-)
MSHTNPLESKHKVWVPQTTETIEGNPTTRVGKVICFLSSESPRASSLLLPKVHRSPFVSTAALCLVPHETSTMFCSPNTFLGTKDDSSNPAW